MIVLDTNILIDLFGAEDHPGAIWSRRTYNRLADDAEFGYNLIVLSELAAEGVPGDALLRMLDAFHVQLLELNTRVAFVAGKAHRVYRQRGGTRQSILADFLIAGHAEALGASLMTRDRRLTTYFPDLSLITPETQP